MQQTDNPPAGNSPPSVALLQPEIPPNSGNIIRLCANTGARLHFIHPLGFALDHRRLRRAGLDYAEFARIREHETLAAFLRDVAPRRLLAFTARGNVRFDHVHYRPDDVLLFGPETRGLSPEILAQTPAEHRIGIPMQPGGRSLNLSNAVAVAVYEAWRQLGYPGATNVSTENSKT